MIETEIIITFTDICYHMGLKQLGNAFTFLARPFSHDDIIEAFQSSLDDFRYTLATEGYSKSTIELKITIEQFQYFRHSLANWMLIKSKNKPKNKFNTSSFLINYLPEESKGNLLDLQERWRTDSKSPLLIELKTMNFWFRHWKCDICSEIGKKVQKSLPSRWI
jgi:hypothetical protein